MEFTKEQKIRMYSELARARVLGEKIIEYIFSGKIAGAIHPCLGQEAINAGLIAAMEFTGIKTYATCTHRQQTIMAYRVGFDPFIAELLGKSIGWNDGISGEYHITGVDEGLIPAAGCLGVAWPIVAGVAWGIKQNKEDAIAYVPYGDGAMSQGQTFETMNVASIMKLPIMFFVENNGIAMSTPLEKQSPVEHLSVRAHAAGLPGITVDGNDVEAVAEAVINGFKMAKNNEPNLVEVLTCRWEGHYVGEDQKPYRDLSFREHLDDIDPVLLYEKKLLAQGVLTEDEIKKIKAERDAEITSGFDKALAAGVSPREMVIDYNRLYSNDAGGEI